MKLSYVGKKASLVVCISCTLFLVKLSAQQHPFKYFSEEEGLPQSTVFSLCEDKKGFLWMGTDGGGLCLMNGNGITTVDTAACIDGKTIRALKLDSNNNLWIGTDAGIVLYDGYTFKKTEGIEGEEVQVLCFFEDTESRLWVGTAHHGCFYIKDQILYPVEQLTVKGIFAINEDQYGRIWVGSYGEGIHLVSLSHDTCVIEKPNIFLSGYEKYVKVIEKIKVDEFLLGTHGAGIKHIKITAPDQYELSDYQMEHKGSENVIIWDILKTSDQAIWIATDKKGVFRIKDEGITTFDNSSGLGTNQVMKLYEDKSKNIWIGTNDKGLSLYLGDEFVRFDDEEFSNNPITSLLKRSEYECWISSYGGGIHKLTLDESRMVLNMEKIFLDLPDNYVTAMYQDREGTNWIGTQHSGLYRIDKNTKTRISQRGGLISNRIYSLFEDYKGMLWCGTDAGISLLDGSGIRNISEQSDSGLINNEVQCFIEDRNKNLWIGTLGGLERIHGGEMTPYGEEDGLKTTEILTMDLQYDSILWIGTKGGGLFRCIDYNDSIPIKSVVYEKANLSNNIRALKFLNDTILIVGTERGIVMYGLNAANDIVYMRRYDTNDGFFGGEVIQNGIEVISGNTLLICTNNGIELFSPDILNMESKSVSVHINQIDLFYKNVDWSKYSDSIIPYNNIPYQLKLRPHENYLTFHVASDNISGKSELSYSYELIRGEDNWSPFQDIARFDFMNIPYGANVFRIKVESDDNYYQDDQYLYEYEIQVPFYLKWWFYALVFLVLLTTFLLILRYREKALRKRNEFLEDAVKKRTLLLSWQKDQIEEQKGLIEKKNQDITDSIQAAKYIQDAVLPPLQTLNAIFNDSFILYWPKDIVSGDFYWIKERKTDILITAADCTGHGVPGAFMSLLGIAFLNNMVSESGNDSPAEILNELRNEVIKSLNQSNDKNAVKSGMDAALIAINKDRLSLEYAGAYNPLILIRNKELIELKADKMPIAFYDVMDPFTNHSMQLQKGDQLYFFSDGFADQFGGPDNKKIKRRQFYDWLLESEDLPFNKQSEMLEKKFIAWKGESDRIDDVVVIGIKV